MDEAALSDGGRMDMPSSKPTRRKRLALLLAVLVVAASALGSVYWFTRPPELVWWTSPPLRNTTHRAKILVPAGWAIDRFHSVPWKLDGGTVDSYWLMPIDRWPRFLRRLFPQRAEKANVVVMGGSAEGLALQEDKGSPTDVSNIGGRWVGMRSHVLPGSNVVVFVQYWRADKRAFDATYKNVCNSLRIE